MTADTPTPTPPDGEPRAAPDPADAPTAQHQPPRPGEPVPSPPADERDGRAPATGLYRSTHDRMLAGVCGGIAERYGIDAVIVRLAFLASLLIGGAGVLFYIAAAIVIPNPPAGPGGAIAPAHGVAPTTAGGNILRILVALAVACAVLCGLVAVIGISFATTVFFGAWPAAVVLIVLGVLLAVVAKNRRSAGTVLVLIVSVAAPAAVAVIADLSVDRSAGDRTETPLTAAETSEGYRLGLGSLTVDLRELPLKAGSAPFEVPVRVDVGRAAIVIPDDRCVAWTIRTSIGFGGDVRVLGNGPLDSWGGYRQARTFRIDHGGDERRPRVTVDAHIGVGEIVVAHSIGQIDRDRYDASGSSRSIRTDACRD
ncbi:MAG: PspC domain-containing protein [Patulibacter sp.]|nr:PspC domain-containing protein [Patulibacter sp.]